MTELIKITQNQKGTNIVSARELYSFLDIKTEFPKWCERMFEYGFVENKDYAKVIVKNEDNSKGGRSTIIDYALTVDTSKEISMIQRTEKGKEARQYFIACEKRLGSYENALILLGVQKEVVPQIAKVYRERDSIKLELAISNAKIIEDSPKVVFADSVSGSKGCMLIRQFAKDLCTEDFKIGQKKVFQFLISNKYINEKHEPYQNFVNMGIFEVITRVIGNPKVTEPKKTTKITGKGAVYLAEKIKTQFNG